MSLAPLVGDCASRNDAASIHLINFRVQLMVLYVDFDEE